MDKANYQVLIESDHWPLIHDFNFCPLSYMDKSWYAELGISDYLETIIDCCTEATNHWLLDYLDLSDTFYFQFNEKAPGSGFALFNTVSLQKVVRYCGLVRWSPFIRTLLWSNQRRVIRESVGDDGYQFAVNAAPLLLGSWPDDFFEKGGLPMDAKKIPYLLDCSGLALFSRLIADSGPGLKQRVLLKFSVQYKELFTDTGDTLHSPDDYSRLLLLFKKVTKVVDPKCLHLLS